MDLAAIQAWVEEQWESHALPSLAEFIEIPALSPAFDDDWAANGYLDDTIDLFLGWLGTLPMEGMSCNVHRLEGRTPNKEPTTKRWNWAQPPTTTPFFPYCSRPLCYPTF